MDQRVFDQLDNLERGAQTETRPSRSTYNLINPKYSAYDATAMHYDHHDTRRAHWQPTEYNEYDFPDQPLALDSFDEQLLRESEQDSRHSQATLGRARLSLLPVARGLPNVREYGRDAPPSYQYQEPTDRRFELSRFALDQEIYGPPTSSPSRQPLQSSPTVRANQRQPLPADYETLASLHSSREGVTGTGDVRRYELLTVEQPQTEEQNMLHSRPDLTNFQPRYKAPQRKTEVKRNGNQTPMIQGVNLVSTHSLPDRLRSIFPYPLFNAIQSKTFDTIFNTNNNFVLSAPTGSGKTAVLELAICRIINSFVSDTFKIVYQAPTKSLCSERQRDWQAKFGPLGLQCAELTGDTDNAQLRNVQQASIIVTTPEKWDSMTRKWKDHQKLVQMVKLFLIDEVHILTEDRGATLEAVVSRMKSVGSDMRFIALSATVPNSDDVATWLGKDPMNPHVPASRERFGEDFRPVRLQKQVCGFQSQSNDFAFDKNLTSKLPDIISKWSQRKPIMVFCFIRSSCVETAKSLANWWSSKTVKDRYWSAPRRRVLVLDKDLRDTIASGVAFHHAGLSMDDRNVVEREYLAGEIAVICCTSTLAVGINLPCHMVIIKNTVAYRGGAGSCKEYSDLEIMQMLGRAGRPQFDDSAVAIIMTRTQRAPYYEKIVSGQEVLESCLHRNLIDHLNAEIGLGTITSTSSAKKWLSGTFLYVRLKENPEYYKIDGDASGRNLDERLEKICSKGIAMLEEHKLALSTPKLHSTEFGDAMARYCIQFETMKAITALPSQSKISEILSAISQAAEFREIRFRAGEKSIYKDLNQNNSIKFPIPVNLELPAHKVSLIIQSVLGAIELPTENFRHTQEYNTAKAAIFQHATRLIRCIVDCQLYLEDAMTTRNALMLARSIGAHVWDDSPLHMKQLDGIGLVSVRKLVSAGIMSIEDLENVETHRIEQTLSRYPPFGSRMQEKAKTFPKLRISLRMVGDPLIKSGEHVTIKIKAEIGFLNESVPEYFQRRPVYVCLLVETSDGHKVHFARISAKKLSQGQDVLFSANFVNAQQSIRAYVMCDEIAGTMRHAVLKPEVASSAFPARKADAKVTRHKVDTAATLKTTQSAFAAGFATRANVSETDEFADPDLNETDFAFAEAAAEFVDIDSFDLDSNNESKSKKRKAEHISATEEEKEPQQLANGKWACNHRCVDKTKCKHFCCREGLDKRPRPPKPKENKKDANDRAFNPKQTQLNMSVAKKQGHSTQAMPTIENAIPKKFRTTAKHQSQVNEAKETRELNRVHNSVETKTPDVPILGSGNAWQKLGQSGLSFFEGPRPAEEVNRFGSDHWSSKDLPEMIDFVSTQRAPVMNPPRHEHNEKQAHADDFDMPGDEDFGPLLEGNDDGNVDFSFFTNSGDCGGIENSWNIDDYDFHDQSVAPPRKPKTGGDADAVSTNKNERLFVVGDTSSESAAKDLAVRRESIGVQFHGDIASQQPATTRGDRSGGGNDVVGSVAATAEDGSFDTDLEWFKETFGTDLFNIVP